MINVRVRNNRSQPPQAPDILIAALGYETRCTHVPRLYCEQTRYKIAISFENRLVNSFSDNKRFFEKNNFSIVTFSRDSIYQAIALALSASRSTKEAASILFDISSMSRPMIATVLFILTEITDEYGLNICFTYCPAVFTEPSVYECPITISSPVTPEFAGWSLEPGRSIGALFGLGFELDQALGAMEYLEPAEAWSFIPFGEDRRYDDAVGKANDGFINDIGPSRCIKYNVHEPFVTFSEIESLVYGLKSDMRPVIVPFGPKMFALLSLLVALIHYPSVTVWRVSGDQSGPSDDRVASGKIIPLYAEFRLKL